MFTLADFGISAGDAYRELDRLRAAGRDGRAGARPTGSSPPLRNGDLATIADVAGQRPRAGRPVTRRRKLADVLEAGREASAPCARIVSGSGPTCAFLCESSEAARRTRFVHSTRDGVCRSARAADGPVAGAQVVGRSSVTR